MVAPPQVMTGIRVEEIVPGTTYPNKLRIVGNNIQHAPCGIHLLNLNGNVLTPTTYVGENTITHTKVPNDAQAGILMQNVSRSIIKGNNVSHPSSSVNWWEAAIRCGGTTNMFFCNTTQHIGKGLFFDSDNRPTTVLVQNTMNQNQTGIFLNYAIIGAQGGNEPYDNIWTTTTAWSPGNPHIESYGIGSVGTQSPFHVRSPGAQYFPTHRTGTNFGIQVPTPTTTAKTWTLGCVYSPPNYKTEGEENPALAEALGMVAEAQDLQPQTDRERSISWAGQFGLYQQLIADEELRNADESLNAYFMEKDAGNIGRLNRAMNDFNALRNGSVDGSAAESLSMVSGIASDILPEQRLAEVLGILYAHIADLGELNDNDAARLREIARMCPLDEGFGVYISRSALLKLDSLPQHYFSDCEAVPAPSVKKVYGTEDTNAMFKVYPNPSNGHLTLNYELQHNEIGTLRIFTTIGNLMYQHVLSSSANRMELDLDVLASGIYLLSIDVNGEQRHTQKVTLMK